MEQRVLLVGIDEAGYGPILGPLAVSATAFDVPAEAVETSLWKLLRSSVSAKANAPASRVAILDSKKLFKPKDGLAKLERSALSTVAAWRGFPPNLRGLLNLLCPEAVPKMSEYAWYRDTDPTLPRQADAGGLRIAAKLLQQDLADNDVRLAGIWSEVLLEGHYNRLVRGTQNKAVVLLGLTLRLMQRVADAHPGCELRFLIDKQGARDHYAHVLLRSFEDRRLKVLQEDQDCSCYQLVDSNTAWQVRFTQSGESHHLATALASIVSKYLRELLMECFNVYWRTHVPALRPTAGYYEDGLRFLKDIQPHIDRLGISRETLIRQR